MIVCDFSFDDDLTIVPTLQEAYDYIEMEEIENSAKKIFKEQVSDTEIKAKEKELADLTRKQGQLEFSMDYYKPFPFFWRPAEILQTVIPGFGVDI